MTQQNINLGTGELTGDGESVHGAFTKIEANFTELFGQVEYSNSDVAAYLPTYTGNLIASIAAVNVTGLATVATTGAYADLSGNPTIPADVSDLTDTTNLLTHVTPFSGSYTDLTSKPTTISGYGITDAFDGVFASLTSKPTTLAGYGITDAFDGVFASLTSKPTTLAGYGITDAATTAQGALADSALQSVPAQTFASLTSKPTTIAGYGITDSYANTDVDAHINVSGATANQILKWTGTDYAWVTSTDSDTTYTAGSGLTLTGTEFSLTSAHFDGVFASLTSKPTTIAGYGITDAFDGVFASLTSKPTTIAGYGITDAFDGVFASLTSKPTTLAGYGITNINGFDIGYLAIPQVTLSGNVTAALTDSGKHFYSTTASSLTVTIPSNANVAFPIGSAITIVVQAAGSVTIDPQAGVSLYLAGDSTDAGRVVGAYGMATIMKVGTDTWFISGSGVA